MTLKVELVIEGDSRSAQKALDDTSSSLGELKEVAQGAAEQSSEAEASTSALGEAARAAAPEIRKVAAGLAPVAQGGHAAAAGLVASGNAAAKAGGRIGGLTKFLGQLGFAFGAGVLVLGVTVAAEAVGSLFGKIFSSGEEATAAMQSHEAVIVRIAKAYSAAAGEAEKFNTKSRAGLELEGAVAIDNLEDRLGGLADKVISDFNRMSAELTLSLKGVVLFPPDKLDPFAKAMSDLVDQIRSGDADFSAFRDRINEIANSSGDKKVRETAIEILALSQAAEKTEQSIKSTTAALNSISGRGVIAELEAEIQMLARSSIERKISNQIRRAGKGVTDAEAEAIRGLVIERENEIELQRRASGERRKAETATRSGRESVARLLEGLRAEMDLLGESNPVQREMLKLRGTLKFATDEESAAVRGLITARRESIDGNEIALSQAQQRRELFEATRSESERLADELARLDDMVLRGVISWELYDRAVKKSAKNMRERWTADLQGTIGQIQGFTGALGAESGKWQEINKAAGIANALISTYTGAAKALELGPIIGPVLAAATIATGLAYVAQIASGGSGGGGGGGGASAAASSVSSIGAQPGQVSQAPGGPSISIQLVGDSHSTDSIEDLFRQINDGLADGHKIRVSR